MPETLTHPTPPGEAAEPPSGAVSPPHAGAATEPPAAPRHRHLAEPALAGAKTRHERMMDEARRIIDAGNDRDVVTRLTGGLAVRHYAIDLDFAERDYSDIDLVGLRRQAGELHDLFADLGYLENLYVAQATGNGQRQFFKPADQLASRAHFAKRGGRYLPVVTSVPPADHIDVFLDAMRMDHVIEMRERLTLNTYAIAPADLFLSKLQIFYLNEKDVHDVVTLCKDVYVDFEDRPGVLNLRYVAETCADDWGLYIDVMSNVDTALERARPVRPHGQRVHARAPHPRARPGDDDRRGQVAALAAARPRRQAARLAARGRGHRRARAGPGARARERRRARARRRADRGAHEGGAGGRRVAARPPRLRPPSAGIHTPKWRTAPTLVRRFVEG